MKNKKKKKRTFSKILSVILLISVILLFFVILYLNIFEVIYIIIAFIIILFLIFGIVILNFRKKRIFRLLGYLLSIIIISVISFVLVYLFNTLGFLFSLSSNNYTLKTYNVVVLDESSYEKITDLDNEIIGINETIDSDDLEYIKENINKKIDGEYQTYEDVTTLVKSLKSGEVNAIILEDSELTLLQEDDIDTYNLFNIIYSINIKNTISDLKEIININSEPFNIYVSGIDTYGSVNSSSRSDVNIVITVNPTTEKILITWIPRDYYVSINDTSYKDKLTHAGIYGVDTSIYAVENLLDIDINYYVKVNFTSFMKVIDVLGGITIYNDEEFTSKDGITFKEGEITLDSETALVFVRERKNVTGGDVGRGKNQIKVLEALINKALTPTIITKYNTILASLDGTFITNMSDSTIKAFIKKEISSRRDWTFMSTTLSGSSSYEYTYTYKNTLLYVMIPDEDAVSNAKDKIKEVLEGE